MSDIPHLSKQQGTPPVTTGQPDVEPPIPMKKKSHLEVWVANYTKYVNMQTMLSVLVHRTGGSLGGVCHSLPIKTSYFTITGQPDMILQDRL